MAYDVSTVRCSQYVFNTQISKFEESLDHQIQAQMTHLITDYEQLSAETAKLCQLLMEMRS